MVTHILVTPPDGLGADLTNMIERLYPICRSITGNGVRESLAIVSERVDAMVHEVPSGTKILDWTVPPEWNIRDAHVSDSTGARIIDFRRSNLHVVSYSVPVRARMSLEELRPHLHTLPDQPDLVPYRTSYYAKDWGFCLSHAQLESMPDAEYDVVIDSTLEPGALTYGEVVIPGAEDGEVLISSHICHPSLCDDNLTGIAIAADVAARISCGPRPRLTHRFVFAPGTIGAICWLDRNRDTIPRIVGGLTLTCLGGEHPFTYKRTERTATPIDRAVEHVLERSGLAHDVIEFFPYGYDERQYNAPGFRAPVGSLMRRRHGLFAEYHTSADDLSFVSASRMVESWSVLTTALRILDRNRTFSNLEPYGEPQLGTRGLYRALGGTDITDAQLAMLWVLNQSDGTRSLLDIAERSGIAFDSIAETAAILESHELLQPVTTALG